MPKSSVTRRVDFHPQGRQESTLSLIEASDLEEWEQREKDAGHGPLDLHLKHGPVGIMTRMTRQRALELSDTLRTYGETGRLPQPLNEAIMDLLAGDRADHETTAEAIQTRVDYEGVREWEERVLTQLGLAEPDGHIPPPHQHWYGSRDNGSQLYFRKNPEAVILLLPEKRIALTLKTGDESVLRSFPYYVREGVQQLLREHRESFKTLPHDPDVFIDTIDDLIRLVGEAWPEMRREHRAGVDAGVYGDAGTIVLHKGDGHTVTIDWRGSGVRVVTNDDDMREPLKEILDDAST